MGLDSSGSGQGPVIGFCEHSKEHFASWKTGNLTRWLLIGLSRTLCSMCSLGSVGSEVFQCHIRPLWWEGNKENSVFSQQFQLNGDSAFVHVTYLDALLLDDIDMTRQTTSNNSIKLYLRYFVYQRRYKNHIQLHKSSFFCHQAVKLLITLLCSVESESSVYSHLKMEHTILVFSHVSI
jgi:hypothetical protein